MAKFTNKDLRLADGQKVTWGTGLDANMYFDGTANQLRVDVTISGTTPTQDYHLSTKVYVDNTMATHESTYNHGNFITASDVTYENLNANGDVGTGSDQVAQGDHNHDSRYYTETELNNGQLDNRYYTESEVDTISGALSSEIDSDISTHAGLPNAHHNQSHAVTSTSDHTATADRTFYSDNSGDVQELAHGTSGYALVSNGTTSAPSWQDLGDTYATDAELATVSGVLSNEIDSDITAHETTYDHTDLHTQSHAMTSTSDHSATNWSLFASNGSGEVTEIAHGSTSGDVLMTNGASAAPTWGTMDHGDLDGRSDDDHTQYILVDGSRGFTGTVSGVTPSADSDLTTKLYVDNKIGGSIGSGTDNYIARYDGTDSIQSSSVYIDDSGNIGLGTASPSFQLETTGDARIGSNLTIGGNLTVSGTTTTVHSEELTVTDKIITVNNGEAGAGITGTSYAGMEVDRGSATNYWFVFDETDDAFKVGVSGTLQSVATRQDSPTDGYIPTWNDSAKRFDTTLNPSDLATDAEVNTISGVLSSEIDSDISSHASNADAHHNQDHNMTSTSDHSATAYRTFYSDSSGDVQELVHGTSGYALVSNGASADPSWQDLGATYATDAELLTVSGALSSEIDSDISSHASNADAHHSQSHTMTSTSDHTSGNWKLFASNGSGQVTEITHGATSGDVLMTNGATAAPTWGTMDHGDLDGTGDDDHTIYIKADGTRAFTGTVSGVTPTVDAHLATKGYVDSEISGLTQDHNSLTGLQGGAANEYYHLEGATYSGIYSTASGIGFGESDGTNFFVNTVSDETEANVDNVAVMNFTDTVQSIGKSGVSILTLNSTGATITVSGTDELTINNDGITLGAGASVDEFSTDGTLAGNSDDAVPTEQAVKTYVDATVVTDHGTLTGRDDDDHTQYILVDGSRGFTATVSGVTPTQDYHLATKSYVDGGGIDRKGRQSIADASSTVSVTFADIGSTNYTISTTLENTSDSPPSIYAFIVTAKTSTGFTVTLMGDTDSANYVLNWSVIAD